MVAARQKHRRRVAEGTGIKIVVVNDPGLITQALECAPEMAVLDVGAVPSHVRADAPEILNVLRRIGRAAEEAVGVDVLHAPEGLDGVLVHRVLDDAGLIDDAKAFLANEEARKHVAIVPREYVHADGAGSQRFPHLAGIGLPLSRGR